MREKIATDLTAQYVYGDAETPKESVSGLKYSGLDETETEAKWNSEQQGCYPTCSLSGVHRNEMQMYKRERFFCFFSVVEKEILSKSEPRRGEGDPPCVYTYITNSNMHFNGVRAPRSAVTPVAPELPARSKSVSPCQILILHGSTTLFTLPRERQRERKMGKMTHTCSQRNLNVRPRTKKQSDPQTAPSLQSAHGQAIKSTP